MVIKPLEEDSTPGTVKPVPVSLVEPVAYQFQLEWVTPGHPLFEAVRRHVLTEGQETLRQGACFYSIAHIHPARIDIIRTRFVDGLGNIIHERVFAVELADSGEIKLQDAMVLGNLTPGCLPVALPELAYAPVPEAWLHENVLQPFIEEVRQERLAEVERVTNHLQLSLTELLQKADENIGRFADAVARGDEGAQGLFAQAEARYDELLHRRDTRKEELDRQKALTLQGVDVLTSVLVLPIRAEANLNFRTYGPDPEVEETAMQMAMAFERGQDRVVHDVHEKNLGYDLTSIDLNSGELRLIEVKGIGSRSGDVMLTPNERRVAADRRDCYWLYVVTDCKSGQPVMREPIRDPGRFHWHEITKIEHYRLSVEQLEA